MGCMITFCILTSSPMITGRIVARGTHRFIIDIRQLEIINVEHQHSLQTDNENELSDPLKEQLVQAVSVSE
jgi:hypothetical protein